MHIVRLPHRDRAGHQPDIRVAAGPAFGLDQSTDRVDDLLAAARVGHGRGIDQRQGIHLQVHCAFILGCGGQTVPFGRPQLRKQLLHLPMDLLGLVEHQSGARRKYAE